MKANLILYNTVLTPSDCFPTNTLLEQYLSTCETQGEYAIEYNGSRLIRLVGDFSNKLLYGGNYCKITFENSEQVFYCFVDNIKWLNDTAVQLELTLDYLATYNPENILGSNSIIKQRTLSDRVKTIALPDNGELKYPYLQRNIEYSNVIPLNTDNVKYTSLIDFNFIQKTNFGDYPVRFLVITIDGNTALGSMGQPYEGLNSVIIPFRIMLDNYIFPTFYRINRATDTAPVKTSDVFDIVQGHIISISVVNYGSVTSVVETTELDSDVLNITMSKQPCLYINKGGKVYFTLLPSYHFTKDLPKHNSLLRQQPYASYVVAQNGVEQQLIDINSIEDLSDDAWTVDVFIQSVYPNNTIIRVKGMIDKSIEYTLPPIVDNFAYAQSAWAEYYASNSATIRDGLGTKHSYDLDIANNNIKSSVSQAAISGTMAVAGMAVGGSPANALAGIGGSVNTLIGSAYAYDNAHLGMEQEKALQQLAWNDIKNAPNRAYNTGYNNNERAYTTRMSGIYLKEPANDNILRNYHNLFGYNINMPVIGENSLYTLFGQPFDNVYSEGTKGGQYFDYLVISTTVTNKSIPNSIKRIIERILEQGIYVWKSFPITSNEVGIKKDTNYGTDYITTTEV